MPRLPAPRPSDGDSNRSAGRQSWAARPVDPATRALLEDDRRYFLQQALSTPCLSAVRRAEGIWIEDLAGHRYMDFHGNNVHHIGYGHPRLREALKRQLDELSFSPRRFTNEPAVALARKLATIAPGALGKVLFAPSGSDAIEIALKLARAATGRFKTISFWDAFHGAGLGAAGVGGEEMFRSGPVGPLLPGTEHVAPFACYRCPYGYRDVDGKPDLAACRLTCASFVRYVLEREGDVAAVVAEPVRSVPYLPPPGFWAEVRRACDDHGALLVFDEIPNGLGKTGRMFTCEHVGVEPDILVLGKALGGGAVPIAAVVARPELDVAGDWAIGHYTHEKNPFTCRAALTTIEIIEEEGLVENARHVGDRALERLGELKARHRLVGDVRGLGLLLGIELVSDRERKTPAPDAAEAVMYRALERGLSFKTTMGNVLTLTPPLIITGAEMERALAILDDCLSEVEREGAGQAAG
jgi:(R)-1-hydroxy-2-aminoethylphosphonate ammonia-lyase